MASRHRAALALALLTGACGDGPVPLHVGQFVVFTTEDPTTSLCLGTAYRLDRHVEQVHKFIGQPPPKGLQVPLHFVEDSICSGAVCYSPADRAIYAETLEASGAFPGALIEHELTHALIHRAWGVSVPSLAEGLAEALTSPTWHSPQAGAPVRAMLDQTSLKLDYPELGRFVRFLIDSDGIEQFKRLYQATQTRSSESIEANFREVYGESLEAIEMRYVEGSPRCRYQLDACDASTAELVGESWSVTFAASCFDPDFYGSRIGEFESIATQRTVEIETEGLYRLRTSIPELLDADGRPFLPKVRLVRCGDCDEQFVRLVQGQHEFLLAPGLYTILLHQIGDSVVTLDLEFIEEGP